MSTHTPGPWGASFFDGTFGGRTGWMVTHPGSVVVRQRIKDKDYPITSKKICDVTDGAYIGEAESAANARLIAAAPDLLAACKLVEAQSNGDPEQDAYAEISWTALRAVAAAIAKIGPWFVALADRIDTIAKELAAS